MTLEFGDTEAYRAFHARYPHFDSSFEQILALTTKVFARRIDNRNLLDDFCFSIGETCRDEFYEIIFLGVNGHDRGASKLLRGLYERAVTLAYILKHPEKVRRFLNYSAINEHKIIEAARKVHPDQDIDANLGPGNTVREVIARYEKHKGEFKTNKGIAGRWDIPGSRKRYKSLYIN